MSEISVRDRIIERREKGVEPEEFLLESGAIEADEHDELGFTGPFAADVDAHVETVQEAGVTVADVAQLYAIDVSAVTDEERSYPAYKVIHTVYKWPSDAALTFDIAVDRALHELTEDWDEVAGRQRPRIVQALRSFQDACYFCGGELVYAEEPVESCCSDRQVLTLHCSACDRRFIEFSTERQDAVEVRSP